jgi:hypothetical protein
MDSDTYMKIALYKSTHPGLAGLYNRFVRWFDQGQYSHCEIIFSDGMSASSSFKDHGVRFKSITYTSDNWDFFEISDNYEACAREWFTAHNGQGYDLVGNVRFALGFLKAPGDRWFCSEALGAALGIAEPWRLSPNGLAALLPILAKK